MPKCCQQKCTRWDRQTGARLESNSYQRRVHAAPKRIDTPEIPSASMKGVLSPLSDGGAAAVVCSAGPDPEALANPLPEVGGLTGTPVDSGVSPCGIDMRGSVVCEIGGSRGCVRMPVTDGVGSDPMGGRDSTGRLIVTSPLLTLLGVGSDSTGRLITGSSLGVAEPTTVSYSISSTAKRCMSAHMRSTAPGRRLHSKLSSRLSVLKSGS